ncbi:sulfite exporter TauE/SafE family protein [Photobacterium sanctipauli]|uniref:Probable membrane transporter protein n=1 Tax=Photobacterium sanctipauli TaxID=1342794 RepID=A0A2T3NZW4_9GAMM|nr:sulfite exporter TauE/SafE family protein [Photobacterium sanctipauli]PSW21823.1 sulfite exporter TauE/SafE family protein [Photobacterium sanctipauli]
MSAFFIVLTKADLWWYIFSNQCRVIMDLITTLFTVDTFLKVGFGSLIGICLGLTGVGGGVLIIPILQVVFGMQIVMAVGTASLISTIVKVNAGYSHIKAGNVEWNALKWMLLGSIPATLLMTELIVHLNNSASLQNVVTFVIEAVIIAIMLFALFTMYQKYRSSESAIEAKQYSNKVAVSAGVTCGSLLGSTGVGGGVLLLPAFNTLLGVSIKKSIGSSLVMALVLSGLTALNYSKGGQSDVMTAVLMSAGAVIGVPIAIRLLKRFSDKQIYLSTMVVISVALLMMFV